MRRKVIACGTNRATPVFKPEINLAMRVQHCLALFAEYRLILNQGHIFNLLQWGVNSTHRDHNSGLCNLVARPVVPGEAESVLGFSLIEIHIVYYLIPTLKNLIYK
jgi:hypothetical protein